MDGQEEMCIHISSTCAPNAYDTEDLLCKEVVYGVWGWMHNVWRNIPINH